MQSRGVLWVSTSADTRGGVGSFVRTMRSTPLWRTWEVRHVVTHRNGSATRRGISFLQGATRFLWQVLVRRPTLVHLHMASYGSFARKSMLLWVARGLRVPVVVHMHGAEFHQFFERSPRLLRFYIRATLENADLVIALGDTWARRLARVAPAAHVRVVPNAVRTGRPVAQPRPGAPVQVLFLGELTDRKGAFTVIEAWARLASMTTGEMPARLVLAGDGEVDLARRRVRQRGLAPTARVLGWVPPDVAGGLVATSQVLVLPSRNEGQPMAVLEAMAHGLCVIVTTVGGLPDLVDADCGVLVPVDDPDALARALLRVVTDADERARLGAAALHRVRERFDVEVTWRQLDTIYQDLQR
jgi:glycosyltransferase involved in cell wall biosynthesis